MAFFSLPPQALFFFLLLTFPLLPVYPFTINSFEIRDLEDSTSFLQQEALIWTISNQKATTRVTECAGSWMLGGLGVINSLGAYERTYTSLVPHNIIHFSISFWILDLNLVESLFSISFDNVVANIFTSDALILMPASNLCGASGKDYPLIKVTGKALHSGNSVKLKISSTNIPYLSSASFGFRDVSLILKNKTSIFESGSTCGFNAITALLTSSCLCAEGKYSTLGLCFDCDPACSSCTGGSDSQCLSCAHGYSFIGQKCTKCHSSCDQCTGTSEDDCLRCSSDKFDYWNGTCLASCPAPLVTKTEGDRKYCGLPCTGSDFVYPNGTCHANCVSPYVEKIIGDLKFCDSPCDVGKFLYWDDSCRDTCPVIFQRDLGINRKACEYHCTKDNYLYQDQSCQPTCDPPLKKIIDSNAVYNLCVLPCSNNEFLYGNNTCIGSCESPYKKNPISSDITLCDSPCPANQFYDTQSLTCVQDCLSPLTTKDYGLLKTCEPAPVQPGINTPSGTTGSGTSGGGTNSSSLNTTTTKGSSGSLTLNTQVIETIGKVTTTVAVVSSFLRWNDVTALFVIAFADLLKYIQYIDVPYPQELIDLFKEGTLTFQVKLSLGFQMPASLQEKFTEHPLDATFERKELHSSFLINEWDDLIQLFTLLLIAFATWPITRIIQYLNKPTLLRIFGKISVIFRWNFFLLIFFTKFDDLTLYISLELKTLSFDSVPAILSFLTCLFMILGVALFLWKIVKIGRELTTKQIHPTSNTTTENNEDQLKAISHKFDAYQIFHKGYKDGSFIQQTYLLFFAIRIIICYLIVVWLYDYPIVQAGLLLIINIVMLVYVIKEKPMKENLNLIESFFYEILIFLVNVCVMILAFLHKTESLTSSLKQNLGKIIIICNITVGIISVVFMLIGFILTVKHAYSTNKACQGKAKEEWLNIFMVPYSDQGMEIDHLSHALAKPLSSNREKQETPRKSGRTSRRKDKRKSSHLYVITNLITAENEPFAKDTQIPLSPLTCLTQESNAKDDLMKDITSQNITCETQSCEPSPALPKKLMIKLPSDQEISFANSSMNKQLINLSFQPTGMTPLAANQDNSSFANSPLNNKQLTNLSFQPSGQTPLGARSRLNLLQQTYKNRMDSFHNTLNVPEDFTSYCKAANEMSTDRTASTIEESKTPKRLKDVFLSPKDRKLSSDDSPNSCYSLESAKRRWESSIYKPQKSPLEILTKTQIRYRNIAKRVRAASNNEEIESVDIEQGPPSSVGSKSRFVKEKESKVEDKKEETKKEEVSKINIYIHSEESEEKKKYTFRNSRTSGKLGERTKSSDGKSEGFAKKNTVDVSMYVKKGDNEKNNSFLQISNISSNGNIKRLSAFSRQATKASFSAATKECLSPTHDQVLKLSLE